MKNEEAEKNDNVLGNIKITYNTASKNLKIYYISEQYINYLRKYDKNVAYNKNSTRPYIGVVYTYNNYNYFAPLASPKEKHKLINPKAIC